MRFKLLLIVIFLLACACVAHAQVTTQNARRTPTGSGAPGSGGSAPPLACVSGPPFGTDYTDTSTTPPTIYKCKSGSLTAVAGGSTGAPKDATYITETANTTLTNEFALGSLATGILKNTTTTGVPSIAVAGDFPTLNQNTTGTAANLSGTPALPNGTTATTQSQADNSTKLATTAYADTLGATKQATITFGTGVQTALGVNIGTAGSPVLNGGALGSPSSAGTIPAFTLGGTVAGGGNQINNVIIGTTTPLAGSFTTLIGSTSTKTPIIFPASDSTTAVCINKADGTTNVLCVNSTSKFVGIGGAATVGLDVNALPVSVSSFNATAALHDTTATAQNVGGGLMFTGLYSGGRVEFGAIKGNKESATTTNYAGALGLYTRADGGNFVKALNISSAGAIQFSVGYGVGTITSDASGNLTSVSDERLKTGLRPFNRGLKAILGLQPIYYHYADKSGLDTKTEYAGLGAANVKKFIPEAVGNTKPDGSGYMTLSDRPLLDALINGEKELAARVEKLEAQNAALTTKVASQQRTIQRLRHRR